MLLNRWHKWSLVPSPPVAQLHYQSPRELGWSWSKGDSNSALFQILIIHWIMDGWNVDVISVPMQCVLVPNVFIAYFYHHSHMLCVSYVIISTVFFFFEKMLLFIFSKLSNHNFRLTVSCFLFQRFIISISNWLQFFHVLLQFFIRITSYFSNNDWSISFVFKIAVEFFSIHYYILTTITLSFMIVN